MHILIVDDSILVRKVIRKALEEIPNLKISGEASNGEDAILKVKSLKPDLVIMDLIMPKMDGLSALKIIMTDSPTRVVMISAFGADYIDLAYNALEEGALAFVKKNSISETSQIEYFITELQKKVKYCLSIPVPKQKYHYIASEVFNKQLSAPVRGSDYQVQLKNTEKKLVIFGSSTGGIPVVHAILSRIKPPFPPIILIQHLPVGFVAPFVKRLNTATSLDVVEATNEMRLKRNTVYVGAGGKHLVLKDGNKLYLYEGDRVNGVIPSIDPTAISASYYYGKNLIVVILTGMGSDGLAGARYSKKNGALVIAQDEESSTIFGMPKAVIDANLTDAISNPLQISSYLNRKFKLVNNDV